MKQFDLQGNECDCTIEIPLKKATYEDIQALNINLQTQLFVKDKEIERLKKDKEIDVKLNLELLDSVERLNNIIDFIVESIEDMWVDKFEEDNWQYDKKVLNRKEFLDKIKELRGDKEC